MNTVTVQKREQLTDYIQREVVGDQAVQGVVVVGSVAAGQASNGSDIDAFVFLDPYDLYAVPAEFQWLPSDGSFHGIFVDIDGAIQLDFKRISLAEWSKPDYGWPEPSCAELSTGWIAFDRTASVKTLVEARTTYPDRLRNNRLDDAILQLDQLLAVSKAERCWADLGPEIAHDRLQSAYEYLVQAIFAYNKQWRPWRSRELSHLMKLLWLPIRATDDWLQIVACGSTAFEGYQARANALRDCFRTLVVKCQGDGLYGDDVVGETFARRHDEPGRDWNIAQWVDVHTKRNH